MLLDFAFLFSLSSFLFYLPFLFQFQQPPHLCKHVDQSRAKEWEHARKTIAAKTAAKKMLLYNNGGNIWSQRRVGAKRFSAAEKLAQEEILPKSFVVFCFFHVLCNEADNGNARITKAQIKSDIMI